MYDILRDVTSGFIRLDFESIVILEKEIGLNFVSCRFFEIPYRPTFKCGPQILQHTILIIMLVIYFIYRNCKASLLNKGF